MLLSLAIVPHRKIGENMERIKLNGRVFKVCKSISPSDVDSRYFGRTLDECYAKPSHMKELIYHEWANWFKTFRDCNFGVRSYNSNIFTLTGIILTDDFTPYLVTIYPTHQEVYPIV